MKMLNSSKFEWKYYQRAKKYIGTGLTFRLNLKIEGLKNQEDGKSIVSENEIQVVLKKR